MRADRVRAAALLLAIVLCAGCATPPPPAPRETYMVMPESGGRVGTVVVTLADGSDRTLHGAYQAMSVSGGQARTFVGDDAVLERTFGAAVAAMPRPPATVSLFFLRGRDELTAESRARIDEVVAEFRGRQSQEVWIIGHTDTVGSDPTNDALSLRRAERARQLLVSRGVPLDQVMLKGRGKRELRVPTPNNTDEPRNRRVEISVR